MNQRLIFFIVAALFARTGAAQLFGEQHILVQMSRPEDVHAADLDGDGDLDVLGAFGDPANRIAWCENLGGGNFGSQQSISTLCDGAICVYSGDLDGDGDFDVISASQDDDKVAWYENLGGGNFGSQQILSTQADSAQSVFAADLDGDGDLDVLSASQNDNKVAWYENLGGGNFGSQQIISTQASGPQSVYAADLDGDGDMDVLSASFLDDKIAWYMNLGDGNFGSQQIISTLENGPSAAYAFDLDNDGDMDVLTACIFGGVFGTIGQISWYMNLGGGNFGSQQIISSPQEDGFYDTYAADLDGDGDLDVLTAATYDELISWHENIGGGIFGPQQIIGTEESWPSSVYAADMDGDSDMDVLTAFWNSQQSISLYENLSAGCTDPMACNYDSDALVANTSCCYSNCGCTNPLAANYLPEATCDNGSCEFRIHGTVFNDENENGIMDGSEYGLPFQTVVMQETGQSYITNDIGNFTATTFQQQIASLEVINTVNFPHNTTPSPQVFNAATSTTTQLMFGVSKQIPNFDISVNLYPSGNTFMCNAYSNHTFSFRNMGNYPIDGVIEIEYDELFQGYQEVTPIDSVIGNTIYMSFENMLPGQMLFYSINLLTPTVDHIGEYVTSHARAFGYYNGAQVAYGELELTMEIACAYDPNDKQAFPLGYTDDHLLLQQTEQEFVIRFQNTGNAPAQNIRIQDTLDVNFDISSFRLISNSHSVMTTIDPETRLIDFFFENIQLPDSVNNEPESHGLISYVITPNPSLPVGTVLENTAYIYFDNNEPIITNTTWTTIHECGGEAAFEPVVLLICDEPQVNFESTYDLVEQYSWHVDGVEAGTNAEFLLSSVVNPEYEISLTSSNPLCTETNTLNYEVPAIELIDPCVADLNCDGFRSTQDLLIILSEFGCVDGCEADLDSNAVVNVVDLIVFISLFDQSCWD